MSVVVNLQQHQRKKGLGLFKTNQVYQIDLTLFHQFREACQLYFGQSNEVYVIERYEGGEDIRNQLLVLYNQKSYGRGFSFTVDDHYDIELRLNAPATRVDIDDFFKFIEICCSHLKLETFLLEGDTYSLKHIEALKEETLMFHQRLVKEELRSGLTIFGCMYPIVVEDSLIQQIHDAPPEQAYALYEKYLTTKQHMDCYYAKPLLYQAQDGTLFARYALTQDVPSIFPIRPFLPFGYNQELLDQITDWKIGLVGLKNKEYEMLTEMDFYDFADIAHFENCESFDEKHVVLTLTKSLIDMILKNNGEK